VAHVITAEWSALLRIDKGLSRGARLLLQQNNCASRGAFGVDLGRLLLGSLGCCGSTRPVQRPKRYAGATGSPARPFTSMDGSPVSSMDGSPVSSRFGFCSDDDRLQTSIRRRLFMVRPNGKSAHTLLDKWSASRAIIKDRV